MKISLLILCASLFFACTKEHGETKAEKEITVDEIPTEIKVPTSLWDAIEGKVAHGGGDGGHEKPAAAAGGEHGGSGGAAEGSGSEAAAGALFMPVDLILTEKNPGVLKDPSVMIHLPRGGGTIDLAPYMGDQAGSFFVRFAYPEVEEGQELQSWFVSKARQRKLGDEVWGAGCGKFFKVSQGLAKVMKGEGLKVNTTRNRHLTLLGGHFVFATKKNGQNFLAQATLKDSRYEALYCEPL